MPSTFELVTDAEDDAVDAVYRAAFAADGLGVNPRFREEQLAMHRARKGFTLVGAAEAGRLVGFAYAYTGDRGQWWHEHVAERVSSELADTWLGGHLEVVELAVLPEARGRGIGAALMTALVADRPEPCALLGTGRRPSPARRLYERLGWIELQHDLDADTSLYGRLLR
ncbi:GNAT family N-acetyltransferase [Amnibacterium setariae]|uniref:N-acetyltransferase n=1 Tax=Amnibacterium setariae TaxID=2306585 RepID=A0A3A1TVQ6_9MICO|nr:GNAT family N-acetyltransferase [Amnibacterium setariae]RIX28322.1 N-acetyltransferase [Amnibacterium setariae]